MSCSSQTLSGLAKDCSGSIGGILEVYIANFDDVTAVTVSGDMITAISLASSKYFNKYLFSRNTGNLTSTATIDKANGVNFITSSLLLQFNRMETTKRVEMTALSLNDLVVIVKDANGKYWYLGKDNPVAASAQDGQTGTAVADANRYQITLEDVSYELPYEVDSSIISGLFPA